MSRHLLRFLLLPLILAAQPEATIHQEYRYQLPKPTLTWTPVTSLPSGLLIIPATAELWGAPNQAGQYNFAVKASDGTQIALNLKVNALWNLSLTPPQAAVGVAFSHAQVIGGGTPPYSFSATQLPPGLAISRDGLISGIPTSPGTYSASITASDRQGNTLNLAYNLYVNPIGITTSDLPPAESGKDYSQQLTATGGTPPYTWSLLGPISCVGLGQRPVLPNLYGIGSASFGSILLDPRSSGDLSPEGLLTVRTPHRYDQTFCVQVTDSTGNKAKSELTVISLEPGAFPPSAYLSPTVEEVSVGDPVFSTVGVYQGTSPYTATALSLPPGFIFYPSQGIVFGYPQTPGMHTIRMEVKDGAGAIAQCETTFRVSPIRVGRASAGSLTYGRPYSQQFYAVNAVTMYSWALVPGVQLPVGLTFSSAGLLSGTPMEAGYFFPTGRITDAAGNSREFWLIGMVSSGTPDTLDLTSFDASFTVNRESSYAVSARGSGHAPYTWTVTGTSARHDPAR